MNKSKIEWLNGGYTWNPSVGCSKVSAGCKNCYAEAMVHRFPHFTGMEMRGNENAAYPEPIGWDGNAHFFPERLEEPFHLRPGKDRPHRIFVCSMSDLFHESLSNEQIAAVFGVMAATPQHQYIVITKRPKRALEWFTEINDVDKTFILHACYRCLYNIGRVETSEEYRPWPLPNVIICASVEDQGTADERIPLLLQIPARWRGVSVEPMLKKIRLNLATECDMQCSEYQEAHCPGTSGRCIGQVDLDLIICGAETGPKKRPFKDEWAIDLCDQCKAAETPFFFKKDGNGKPTLKGVEYHEWIKG